MQSDHQRQPWLKRDGKVDVKAIGFAVVVVLISLLVFMMFGCSPNLDGTEAEKPEDQIKATFQAWVTEQQEAGEYWHWDTCDFEYARKYLDQLDGTSFAIPPPEEVDFFFADVNNDGKLDGLATYHLWQCDGGNASAWMKEAVLLIHDKGVYRTERPQLATYSGTDFAENGFFQTDSISTGTIHGTYIEFKPDDGFCCPSTHREEQFDYVKQTHLPQPELFAASGIGLPSRQPPLPMRFLILSLVSLLAFASCQSPSTESSGDFCTTLLNRPLAKSSDSLVQHLFALIPCEPAIDTFVLTYGGPFWGEMAQNGKDSLTYGGLLDQIKAHKTTEHWKQLEAFMRPQYEFESTLASLENWPADSAKMASWGPPPNFVANYGAYLKAHADGTTTHRKLLQAYKAQSRNQRPALNLSGDLPVVRESDKP